MKIEVHHRQNDDVTFVHVATVDAPTDDLADAMDFAFAKTQNIEGSWSKGPTFPAGQTWNGKEEANPDHDARVTRIGDLEERNGRTLGYRSTMTGDRMREVGPFYAVASFGFDPLFEPHPGTAA